jgi:hypothetical protein
MIKLKWTSSGTRFIDTWYHELRRDGVFSSVMGCCSSGSARWLWNKWTGVIVVASPNLELCVCLTDDLIYFLFCLINSCHFYLSWTIRVIGWVGTKKKGARAEALEVCQGRAMLDIDVSKLWVIRCKHVCITTLNMVQYLKLAHILRG